MERKADIAYEQIKHKIITGTLKPMIDINEEALQKELNFSRTPIREALLKLQVNGYIVVFPNKGTFVTPVSRELIDEIYDMRLLNEPYICKRACHFIPKDLLLMLKSQLSDVRERDLNNKDYFISLDSDLHLQLLKFCNNSFLISAMQNVYDHNERIRYFASDPIEDHSIDEHIAIIDAILNKDDAAIDKAVIAHITASKQISINCFKQQPFF